MSLIYCFICYLIKGVDDKQYTVRTNCEILFSCDIRLSTILQFGCITMKSKIKSMDILTHFLTLSKKATTINNL